MRAHKVRFGSFLTVGFAGFTISVHFDSFFESAFGLHAVVAPFLWSPCFWFLGSIARIAFCGWNSTIMLKAVQF